MRAKSRIGEDGFVLVGVVMMVLALTILGLSLFSLSSYEAQFMNHSLDSDQALQCALGGLDRARFALATLPDLSTVKNGLPRDNVFYARATQVHGIASDTVGAVLAGGNPILIEVAANYRGVIRWVKGSYVPTGTVNYYKRLLTVQDWIKVNDQTGDPLHLPIVLRCGTVALNGRVWEYNAGGSTDTLAWQGCANSWVKGVDTSTLPVPDASTFIADNQGLASPPVRSLITGGPLGSIANFQLLGPYGKIQYWYSNTGDPNFSVYERTLPSSITVNGLAVWLLPRGIRFDSTIPVSVGSGGDPKACLVIVASPGIDPFTSNPALDPAIWFFGGGLNASIPVVLVSDGQVFIEQTYNMVGTTAANKISIFSRYAFFNGPDNTIVPLATMNLGHDPAMDPTIDTLLVHRALPNSTAVTGVPYSLIPGTWRASQ